MTIPNLKLIARTASVYLKIASGLIGLLAAFFWYKSATVIDGSALNATAAATTAIAVSAQAVSAIIDWWISPTASWA